MSTNHPHYSTTPAMASLLVDARAAGYTVTPNTRDNGEVQGYDIAKADRHGNIRIGVRVATNVSGRGFGFAHRTDVRVDLATTIRTITATRTALGI